MHIGYPCLHQTLATERVRVTQERIRRTFLEKGLAYGRELIGENLDDLQKVIEWNDQHQISFDRMSNNFFPG